MCCACGGGCGPGGSGLCCAKDTDCPADQPVCIGGSCAPACANDDDCPSGLCNAGVCCLTCCATDTDCRTAVQPFCESGSCSGCSDTTGGAIGLREVGCGDHTRSPGSCGMYDDDDFSADRMCCGCGGGCGPSGPGLCCTPATEDTDCPADQPFCSARGTGQFGSCSGPDCSLQCWDRALCFVCARWGCRGVGGGHWCCGVDWWVGGSEAMVDDETFTGLLRLKTTRKKQRGGLSGDRAHFNDFPF